MYQEVYDRNTLLVVILIYLIIAGIVTVFIFIRYFNLRLFNSDYFWTVFFFLFIWALTGLIVIWYSWILGNKVLSLIIFIIVIIGYIITISVTYERKRRRILNILNN